MDPIFVHRKATVPSTDFFPCATGFVVLIPTEHRAY